MRSGADTARHHDRIRIVLITSLIETEILTSFESTSPICRDMSQSLARPLYSTAPVLSVQVTTNIQFKLIG